MQVDSTQWNGANFRRAAWACGWELFKQHPLIGVDIGDKKVEVVQSVRAETISICYTDKQERTQQLPGYFVQHGLGGIPVISDRLDCTAACNSIQIWRWIGRADRSLHLPQHG
jgi:hypothetical protein